MNDTQLYWAIKSIIAKHENIASVIANHKGAMICSGMKTINLGDIPDTSKDVVKEIKELLGVSNDCSI